MTSTKKLKKSAVKKGVENHKTEPSLISPPLLSTLTNESSTSSTPTSNVLFRIMAGSYEHNLLCLQVILDPSRKKDAVFHPVFHFQAHTLSIKSMDLAKRYLVTGSNDEHIRIYDLQKRKELGNLMSHQGTVTTLKFSRENLAEHSSDTAKSGKWLLSGSEDGKIIIWRTKDWESFGILKGHLARVNDLDIHPSGRVAISVSQDNTVRLWNLMTAKKAAILKIRGKHHLGHAPDFVRWSTNGDHFVVAMSTSLLVYNTKLAKILRKITFKSPLVCLELMDLDGVSTLATGHQNGQIAFYPFDVLIVPSSTEKSDEQPGKPTEEWDGESAVVEPEFVLQGHTNRVKGLTLFRSAQETHNVPYLVLVSSDGKIVIWDLSKDVRDQVAIYDTGERLNCVVASSDNIEKTSTMKRRFASLEEMEAAEAVGGVSESEYETDGEEIRKIMAPKSKKNKRKQQQKISVQIE